MAHVEASLLEFLGKIAKEQYYDDPKIVLKQIIMSGNFTSALFAVTISAPDKADLQLFTKVAVLSETFRKEAMSRCFDAERVFYTRIARTYDMLQDKHNLRAEERIIFPKFYGCSPNYLNEIVVLENLTTSGFVDHDRFKAIDWDYAAKSVEELAKFHALSMAYGEEDSEACDEMLEEMRYVLLAEKKLLEHVWGKTVDTAVEVAKEEYKDKLKKFFEECSIVDRTWKYNQPQRRAVLVHGDFKKNNLMHRVRSDGTLQLAIIDYQGLKSSSPVTDLIYFIFNCTDQQFRSQHFDQTLEHYYTKLRAALRRFDLDPDKVYSKDDFDYEMEMSLPYGLCMAVSVLAAVLSEAGDTPAPGSEMSMLDFAVKPSPVYVDRLNGVLHDCVEWGIL